MDDFDNMTAELSATPTCRPRQLDKFLFLIEQMQQMNGNITRQLYSWDNHSTKPDCDDPPDRGESATQDKATEASQGGNKDLNLKGKQALLSRVSWPS